MPNYDVLLFWNEAARLFVAEVAELPGVRGSGTTPETAVAEARRAAIAWLERALVNGKMIPVPCPRLLPA